MNLLLFYCINKLFITTVVFLYINTSTKTLKGFCMLKYNITVSDDSGSSSTRNPITYTANELVAIATAELGYHEKNSAENLDSKTASNDGNGNYTKYNRDLIEAGYYDFGASAWSFEWCDCFYDWCIYQLVCKKTGKTGKDARIFANSLICQPDNGLGGACCSISLGYYKNAGRLGYYPVKGAQVFFSKNNGININHTGMVIGYDNDRVYTIEGNADNAVIKRDYPRRNSTVYAYGYPKLTGLKIPEGSVAPDPPSPIAGNDDSGNNSSSENNNNNSEYVSIYNSLKYTDTNPPLYCLQSQSLCYRNTTTMDIKGVLWHSTGCENTNIKRYVQPDDNSADKDYWISLLGKNEYGNDWNHSFERKVGVNAWIGKLANGEVSTVQTLPWNYRPWGCGGGSNGSCNDGWIQFEICEDNLLDENYFNKIYEEACQLTAYLCKKYNLNPNGIVSFNGQNVPVILDHYISNTLGLGSDHVDTIHWFKRYGKSMNTVREDVARIIEGIDEAVPVIKTGDIVKISTDAVSTDGQKAQPYITNNKWKVSEATDDSNNEDFLYATIGERADTSKVVLNKKYRKRYLTVTSADSTISPSPNTGTVTNEELIWNTLALKVKDSNGNPNAYGIAGIMGNMMAESGLKANNVQDNLTTFTDESYTAAVDNGTYTNFVYDGYGYGLVQFTYYTLKRDLLAYAKSQNKSIGDTVMQIEFLCKDLATNYTSVWNTCCNATSVLEASNKMLHSYERPYGHDSFNKATQEKLRGDFGQGFYDRHKTACTHTNTTLKDAIDATCSFDGYTGDLVCTNCGQTVNFGSIIPAKQHQFVNGVCSVCGANISSIEDWNGIYNGIVEREDLEKVLAWLKEILQREGNK